MKHVQRFLEEGNKVKITIMLRGREKSAGDGLAVPRPGRGRRRLGKLDGRFRKLDWAVSALLVPSKKEEKMPKLKTHQGAKRGSR